MSVKQNIIIPNKDDLLKAYDYYIENLKTVVSSIEENLKSKIQIASRPTFKSRVKRFDSYYKKLLRTHPDTLGMQRLPVLSDMIGIRVICAFLEDLSVVEKQIIENYQVVEIERKGANRTFSEFGYESTHVLIEILKK